MFKKFVSFGLLMLLIASFLSISTVHAENDIPDIIEIRPTDYNNYYLP